MSRHGTTNFTDCTDVGNKSLNKSVFAHCTLSYTNDLHDALLRKEGVAFWKCWKSKFECGNRAVSHITV